ncbi:MAG: hypothetical protein Q7R48_02200, partial [bacterium]|nr:hypothetical protein [bacterium]
QKLERSIAGIQKNLTALQGVGAGRATLSDESLAKIKDLEENQTRKQVQLARIREGGRTSPATPPSTTPTPSSAGDTSTGSTGPGGPGPRPGNA